MKIFRDTGYALLPVLMTALVTGTLGIVVTIATKAHQQPSGTATAISVATDVSTTTRVPAPQALPAGIPAANQTPTNMDVFSQKSITLSEPVEAPKAVPTTFTKSGGQVINLIDEDKSMWAKMTATKTNGKLLLDISYYLEDEATNPEVFLGVSSVTCVDGSKKSTAEIAYGQWLGHKVTTTTYLESLPCDPVAFTLSAMTEATYGPFWTMKAKADVVFTS